MNLAEIEQFLRFNSSVKSVLLVGDSGKGKTAFVKNFADRLGPDWDFVDLRLAEMEPTDFLGIPYRDNDVTKYARPEWWPQRPKTVIFLDELDRCRREMHSIALQFVSQRRAGQRDLPADIYIFAAANGPEYKTIPIDQAVMRRFAVIDFEPTVDEWLNYAKASGHQQLVIDYITQHKDRLDIPENLRGVANTVVPTRSSWSDFSAWLSNAAAEGTIPDNIGLFAAPFLGYTAAEEFDEWIKNGDDLSLEALFSNSFESKKRISPIEIASLATRAAAVFLQRPRDAQYNALIFFKEAGEEFFVHFFSLLPKRAHSVIESFPDIHDYILTEFKKVSLKAKKNAG